jgi:hypothetical protein
MAWPPPTAHRMASLDNEAENVLAWPKKQATMGRKITAKAFIPLVIN